MACRLCLSLQNNSLKLVSDSGTPISEIHSLVLTVFPQIDVHMSHKPMACDSCVDSVKQFASFKKAALQNEEKIKSYKNDHVEKGKKHCNLNLNLQEVLLHYNPNFEARITENLCRICLGIISDDPIDIGEDDECAESIQYSLPELNFRFIKNPLCCRKCSDCVKQMNKFREKCLEIQNFLFRHITSEGQVLANDDLKQIAYSYLVINSDSNSISITQEDDFVKVEPEIVDVNNVSSLAVKIEFDQEQECIKEEGNKCSKIEAVNTNVEEETVYRCPHCIYNTLVEPSLIRHVRYKHKVYDEEPKFKCSQCPYQCPNSYDLKRHVNHKHRRPKRKLKAIS